VNVQLRKFRDEGATFDVIVLDPPKYAPSRSALDRASRAYKDLNRLGMQLLNSGGLLATFSCSGAMDMETFKQVLAWAALDAGKQVQFIYQFHQPEDHPVRASFPEGEYLKGLLCAGFGKLTICYCGAKRYNRDSIQNNLSQLHKPLA
jgi:23S rRNA (cytosine1962-C5)-methyltransferase